MRRQRRAEFSTLSEETRPQGSVGLSFQWSEMAEKAKEAPQLTLAMDREMAASLAVSLPARSAA